MTDFDHADISRRLALAIGWPEHKLYSEGDGSFVSINTSDMPPIKIWRDFDYRDFSVIWPVAERFNCFPYHCGSPSLWFASAATMNRNLVRADTASLAVALAVINAKESK